MGGIDTAQGPDQAGSHSKGWLPTGEAENPIASQSIGCVPSQSQSGAEGLVGSWTAAGLQSILQD